MCKKSFFLIITLLSLSHIAQSQVTSGKDAFSKYRSGDYESAIRLYRAKLAQKPSVYERFMLGMCYLKTDSIAQAEEALNEVITEGNSDRFNDNLKVQACNELAILYLKEKNYRQALKYYQLYAAIFEKARFDDVNWARFHFFNANDQGRCFAVIGQTDSAINVMTPYMFFTYKNLNQGMFMPENYRNNKDSLQHDSISRFYVTLLRKKYTNKQIKTEFKKAERSFVFTEDRKPANQYGFRWESIRCSIDIYGHHVVFVERSIGNKEKELIEEIRAPYYSRAYQLAYFRQLPICNLINDLRL